nr:hemolysin XhlA family protein [Sporosarcina limicola]
MNEMLSDIRERMVRVETKIDTMTEVQNTADRAKETAAEALSSTRSAHKRIDKIDNAIFWLSTTVVGAVITGAIAFIMKGGI